MKNTVIAGISAAALAAGLGVGVNTLANADTASPTPTATASPDAGSTTPPSPGADAPAPSAWGGPHRGGPKGPGPQDTAALAEALGLDEEKVIEALDSIRADLEAGRASAEAQILDDAVADGTITRSEADAVKKAIDAGLVTTRHHGPRR